MNAPKRPQQPQRHRSNDEMISHFAAQLQLLQDYETQAFSKKNDIYIAEVASKLRVLTSGKGNKPLLFEIAKHFGFSLYVHVPPDLTLRENNPTGGMSLEKYFTRIAHIHKNETGLNYVSNAEFIKSFADKSGAHVDWSEDMWFKPMVEANGFRSKGVKPAIETLRHLAQIVIVYGKFALDEAKRINADNPLSGPLHEEKKTLFQAEMPSMLLIISTTSVPKTGKIETPINLDLSQAGMILRVEITRRRRCRFTSYGLPTPYFSFDAPLPVPLPPKIHLMLSYDGKFMRAFFDAKQVAGPPPEEAHE